jgi:hypothetical protein
LDRYSGANPSLTRFLSRMRPMGATGLEPVTSSLSIRRGATLFRA